MNNPFANIPFSILDLGTVKQGQTIQQAIHDVFEHAQRAEELGFHRFWIAEHHNMSTVTTAATAVLIGQIAARTSTIRVGAGGIMLPNHSPLAIAEQFGTLDVLFPNRIDLGLGRAPGTDQLTAAALRRNNLNSQLDFPQDIRELLAYFENTDEAKPVRAFPGEGQNVPVYILGSSVDSAYLAAEYGMPYAFAAHFAPQQLRAASQIYRTRFQPSSYLKEPYQLVACNVITAPTAEEAQFLSSSIQELFVGILTNTRTPLPEPKNELPELLRLPEVQAALQRMLAYTFVGDPYQVSEQLAEFAEFSQADELILTNYIQPKAARLKAMELMMGIQKGDYLR